MQGLSITTAFTGALPIAFCADLNLQSTSYSVHRKVCPLPLPLLGHCRSLSVQTSICRARPIVFIERFVLYHCLYWGTADRFLYRPPSALAISTLICVETQLQRKQNLLPHSSSTVTIIIIEEICIAQNPELIGGA